MGGEYLTADSDCPNQWVDEDVCKKLTLWQPMGDDIFIFKNSLCGNQWEMRYLLTTNYVATNEI